MFEIYCFDFRFGDWIICDYKCTTLICDDGRLICDEALMLVGLSYCI
jgi:hypothetical protein